MPFPMITLNLFLTNRLVYILCVGGYASLIFYVTYFYVIYFILFGQNCQKKALVVFWLKDDTETDMTKAECDETMTSNHSLAHFCQRFFYPYPK